MLTEKTCKNCGWTKQHSLFIAKKKDGSEYSSDYCSSCRKAYGKKQSEQFKDELKTMYHHIEQDNLKLVLSLLITKALENNDRLEEAIIDSKRLVASLEQFQHDNAMVLEFLQIWKEDA
jgi:hypothetical protein